MNDSDSRTNLPRFPRSLRGTPKNGRRVWQLWAPGSPQVGTNSARRSDCWSGRRWRGYAGAGNAFRRARLKISPVDSRSRGVQCSGSQKNSATASLDRKAFTATAKAGATAGEQRSLLCWSKTRFERSRRASGTQFETCRNLRGSPNRHFSGNWASLGHGGIRVGSSRACRLHRKRPACVGSSIARSAVAEISNSRISVTLSTWTRSDLRPFVTGRRCRYSRTRDISQLPRSSTSPL